LMSTEREIGRRSHGWILATSVQCHPERSEGSRTVHSRFLGPSALGMTKSGYDGFSSPRCSIKACPMRRVTKICLT
jgi:hypothetical protein